MGIYRKTSFVAVIIFLTFTGASSTCPSPQYLELGKEGVVECHLDPGFEHVYWYDYSTSSTVVVLNERENGEVVRSGKGYTTGTYNITSRGELVIHSVVDGQFKVGVIGSEIIGYNVTLISTVKGQNYPFVTDCGREQFCYISSFTETFLTCTFDAKPAVELAWQQMFPVLDQDLRQSSQSSAFVSNDGIVMSTHSSLNMSPFLDSPLTVITCVASGPAVGTQKPNSTVIIENTYSSDSRISEIITKKSVIRNSQQKLKCRSKGPDWAFLWKKESYVSAKMLMFAVNNRVLYQADTISNMDFLSDGSLIIDHIAITSEGNYTCLSSDGEQFISDTVVITVLVPPNPPVVSVANCMLHSSVCTIVTEANITHTVSCGVTGVYPLVDIQVAGLNSSDFILINMQSSENMRGQTYDISTEVLLQMAPDFSGSTSLTCSAVGAASTVFDAQTIIEFTDGQITSDAFQTLAVIYILLAVYALCSIIILIVIVGRFYRRILLRSEPTVERELLMSEHEYALSDAMQLCREKVIELLGISLEQTKEAFDISTINELRIIAEDISKVLKAKNRAQIGGITASLAGRSLGITGTILLPFTAGMSAGMMAVGAGVGVAGAGTNIGVSFTLDKKNKARVEKIKPTIEKFVDLHINFAKAAVIITGILRESAVIIAHSERLTISDMHRERFNTITALIRNLRGVEDGIVFEQKIQSIADRAYTLGEFFLSLLRMNDKSNALSTSFRDMLEKSQTKPIEMLGSLKPIPVETNSEHQTFSSLFTTYIITPPEVPSNLNDGGDTTRVFGGTGSAGGAVAMSNVTNVGDDVARIGGNALRIAGVLSAAGLVLGSVGVAFDILYLTQAFEDEKKIKEAGKKLESRKDGKKETKGDDGERNRFEFCIALIDLADSMEEMNGLLKTP